MPLTTGELGRYLAATLVVITTSAVGWRHLRDSAAAGAVTLLGRRSLAIYGGHVFVQMLVVAAAARLWWLDDAQGLVVTVPTLAALWALAHLFDRPTIYRTQWRAARRVVETWAAPPAGIAMTALLIAGLASTATPPDLTTLTHDEPPPAIELVDTLAEPGANVSEDAPPDASMPDDAPIQSGIGAPLFA